MAVPELSHVAGVLLDGGIPKPELWEAALREHWEKQKRALRGESQPLFAREFGEVRPHLRALAEALYRVCAEDPKRFQLELLRRVRDEPQLSAAATLPALVSADQFFAPFTSRDRLFHHEWEMVGREEPLDRLLAFATAPAESVAVLPGRGGIGKTRLLREFAGRHEEAPHAARILFILPGMPITSTIAEELARSPCIVVMDDAHANDGLDLLLAVARRTPNVKLVLSTRPRGVDRILSSLGRAGFDLRETVRFGDLRELERDDVEALARQALGRRRAHLVDALVTAAWDSPLVALIGGQLIAEGNVHPSLMQQHEEFRRVVLTTFEDVLLGKVSERIPPQFCRALLRVISAVGPIYPRTERFRQSAAAMLDTSEPDVVEAVGVLEDAGVLLRRGESLRVTPDVLADHILEEACLTASGGPTGYARAVFETFGEGYRVNVLKNLAELDWRVRHSGARRVDLFSDVWSDIEAEFRAASHFGRTQILEAITDVAYYQPSRILHLVELALRSVATAEEEGPWASLRQYTDANVREKLPPLLRRVAYNADYTTRCLNLLWELGRDDPRETNPHPQHAMRVLIDLAEYDTDKPLLYNELVLSAVEQWVEEPSAHEHVHSPLDVLDPLLEKTGMSDKAHGLTLIMQSFQVNPTTTKPIRDRAFALLGKAVRSGTSKGVIRALGSLRTAARNPLGSLGLEIGDEDRKTWEPEQVRAFEIAAALCAEPRDPLVHLAALQVVDWHALYAMPGTLRDRAEKIVDAVPKTFELFLTEGLLPESVMCLYADEDDDSGLQGGRERRLHRYEQLKSTAAQLVALHPVPAQGFAHLVRRLDLIESCGLRALPSYVLSEVAQHSPSYAAALCEIAVEQVRTPLSAHLGTLLPHVQRADPHRYGHIRDHIVQHGDATLCAALARGLHRVDWTGQVTTGDENAFRTLLVHEGEWVRYEAVNALSSLAELHPRMAVDLALSMKVGSSSRLADELAQLFDEDHGVDPKSLTEADWTALFRLLEEATDVGGYHMGKLFAAASARVPRLLLAYFFNRLDHDREAVDGYRPLPFRFEERLDGFADSAEFEDILRDIRDRALRTEVGGDIWVPELFRSVSNGFADVGLGVLREWVDSGDSDKIRSVGYLLREANPGFIFQEVEFVARLLESAHAAGEGTFDSVEGNLLNSAISGVQMGTPGKPMGRDVAIRDRSGAILDTGGLSAPVHKFYEFMAAQAEESMRRKLARDEELM